MPHRGRDIVANGRERERAPESARPIGDESSPLCGGERGASDSPNAKAVGPVPKPVGARPMRFERDEDAGGKPGGRFRRWRQTRRTNLDSASILWLWWCAALLAHYDDRMHWHKAGVIAASVAVSALGMLCARSPAVAMAVAALQLGAFWALMPGVDNHWAFAAFVDVALIAATATWMIGKRRLGAPIGPLDDDWYRLAAPILRLLVLVMYGFAVFHKLNSGFLDPDTSCAVHFYRRLTHTPLLPLPGGTLTSTEEHALVIATLVVEAAIPILLAGRRTWFVGIAVGVAFHMSTGMFMRHYPSIMMALYWVFVPMSVQRRWVAAVDEWIRRVSWRRVGYAAVVAGSAVALSIATMAVHQVLQAKGLSKGSSNSPYWWVLRAWNAFVFLGGAVACAAFVRAGGAAAHPAGRFRSPAPPLYAIALVFAINCLSPYLGLKTTTSINMWSNLVVTGTEDNHLLLSASAIRMFDYTSDVVTVVKSNDRELEQLASSKSQVPWLTFRREVGRAVRRAKSDKRAVFVRYARGGAEVTTRDAANDPVLMDRGSYWERKLIAIKPTPGHQPARCSW